LFARKANNRKIKGFKNKKLFDFPKENILVYFKLIFFLKSARRSFKGKMVLKKR
jgi:hypothetical protein